jgi:hypothetical protein
VHALTAQQHDDVATGQYHPHAYAQRADHSSPPPALKSAQVKNLRMKPIQAAIMRFMRTHPVRARPAGA